MTRLPVEEWRSRLYRLADKHGMVGADHAQIIKVADYITALQAKVAGLTEEKIAIRNEYIWAIGSVFGCAGFAREHTTMETMQKIKRDDDDSRDACIKIIRVRAEAAEARAAAAEADANQLMATLEAAAIPYTRGQSA